MAQYVLAEYWEEGYAEGDAFIVGMSSSSVSASELAAGVIFSPGTLSASTSSIVFGVYRVLSGAGYSPSGLYTVDGYWIDGYVTDDELLSARSEDVFACGNVYSMSALSANDSYLVTSSNCTFVSSFDSGMSSDSSFSGRLRWESEREPSDGWFNSVADSGVWVDSAGVSDGWIATSVAESIWTSTSSEGDPWSEV